MAPSLTLKDKRLLRFPPTKKTWICQRAQLLDVDGKPVKVKCGQLNSGSQHICWMCGHARPKTPHLLWPAYVKACEKAGIEPGTRWPVRAETPTPTPGKATRRKKAA